MRMVLSVHRASLALYGALTCLALVHAAA